jgi:hypothetical protein
MMKALILVLLCCLFAALPAFAQEVTPEATSVIVAPLTEQGSDTVTIPGWILINASAVFMALGAGAVLLANWQRSRDLKTALDMADRRSKDAIENAYQALPDSAQELIHRALDTADYLHDQAGSLLNFLNGVTDGLPNDEAEIEAQSANDCEGCG